MDIEARIRRRRQRGTDQTLVLDYDLLNPAVHVPEPVGRGPVVERLLDHLNPVFDGSLPPDGYVWGPPGSGKSAVVSAVFSHLETPAMQPRTAIQTTTRAQSVELPRSVYVNGREVDSEFQLYRQILSDMTGGDGPSRGVSTDTVTARLQSLLSDRPGAVIAVDHADALEQSPTDIHAALATLDDAIAIVFIGQTPPSDVDGAPDLAEIEIPGYGQQVLIDVLMTRGSSGLADDVLTYDQARQIASRAGGNAHDALAALFGATVLAEDNGRETLRSADIEAGIEAVPKGGTSLGTVLALAPNRRRVLRAFLELDDTYLSSVSETTEAIADSTRVDLSTGTIRRFLYELADADIFHRVTAERTSGSGRPPSRLEPRFPTIAFRKLYDLGAD
ncbi:Cdc6/Cdc18 family protein [Halorhabdus salina]|uniref:Cdc6/Cdc18 family protein n=1 Tax=Halorhabdus salina TaxID=2750670 RepID=UPI0015EE5F36|nr:AAA family ATPase [Halorhabdus salina]